MMRPGWVAKIHHLKKPLMIWALLLVFILPLREVNPESQEISYAKALRLFQHGRLDASQDQAALGYLRSRNFDVTYATKFRLLEAESMVWRGMYDDALAVLAVIKPPLASAAIKKTTLEAVALMGKEQFKAAAQSLSEADILCRKWSQSSCGDVWEVQGILALKQGRNAEARQYLLATAQFARAKGDPWLEANALLNVGVVALQENRLDEAVDLSESARRAAVAIGAEEIAEVALGNLGWGYFGLGDSERALGLFFEAENTAKKNGAIRAQINWLTTIGTVYTNTGKVEQARQAYQQALAQARAIDSKDYISGIITDLALVEIASRDPDKAERYVATSMAAAKETGSRDDLADALAIQMQIAALRGDTESANQLLGQVESMPESQPSMKWSCHLAMANLYRSIGQNNSAESQYVSALNTFEAARAELRNVSSQLPFVANAGHIYDDYVDFLVETGRSDEALMAADRSRARTLAQGLGEDVPAGAKGPISLVAATAQINVKAKALTYQPRSLKAQSPRAVAGKAGGTLLFYWLGERRSFVWVVTPAACQMVALPGRGMITPLVERYGRLLQGVGDPLLEGGAANATGRALYEMLVSPVAGKIQAGKPVMLLADGPLSTLNFETLIAPGSAPGAAGETKAGHYWIEDVTLMSAPSLAMLAAARPASLANGRMLLVGDAVSPGADYPELPYAAGEMREVETHFASSGFSKQRGLLPVVFRRESATPAAYLQSEPGRFGYIHFVSHGVASRTDPLDSAIILSRAGAGSGAGAGSSPDAFKLYAREVMRHPIDARLVTISACYGSGTRAYAGEGLVGLSWAFLRAGAHNTIGALWEATDASTPRLMGDLYAGLGAGLEPGEALRQAKLGLLHSGGKFRKPFYWAPFQIYTRL